MNCYIVKKVPQENLLEINSEVWKQIIPINVDKYLWAQNAYRPKVEAKLCYSMGGMNLLFTIYEKAVSVNNTKINSKVYEDSAVEFFINLFPESTNSYFNFEFNSDGVLRVEFGSSNNRKLVDEKLLMNIHPSVQNVNTSQLDLWKVCCHIPFEIFEFYYCKYFAGNTAHANFYKCGDKTEFEHYGVWNNLEGDIPNFHQPENFGKLKFR